MSKNLDLKQVHDKIKSQYTDRYGFITYNPVSYSDPDAGRWDHDNQHLWTGEVNLLCRFHNMWEWKSVYDYQFEKFDKSFKSTEIFPGLHTRNAPIELYLYSLGWNAFSLDEHDGIAFSAAAIGVPSYVERIVQYGENYGWAFIEHDPRANGLPTSVKEWWNFAKGLGKLLWFAVKNRDFSGSSEMDKIIFANEQLSNASRIRLPKDRAFLKVVAGRKPGFFAWCHFLLASYQTCKKDKKEISGKNRLFFRLLSLQCTNPKLLGIGWLTKTFHRNMQRQYGKSYMHHILSVSVRNSDHPLHVLIEGIELM